MTPSRLSGVIVLLLSLGAVALWVGCSSTLPDYVVRNRLPDGTGAVADVLIPSLSRDDLDREAVMRAVADAEALNAAFFFSTEEALLAHQSHLPSPAERAALGRGFLGQLRDGEFTPGEHLYPE